MTDSSSLVKDAVVSGLISAVIGTVVIVLLSFVIPFPWGLGQTVVSVAIATFSGSAAGFSVGRTISSKSAAGE